MSEEMAVCPSNLGPEEEKQRWRMGAVCILLTIVVSVLFLLSNRTGLWKSILFFPAFLGILGVLQARLKMCVYYACRGRQRIMGITEEVDNPVTARLLRSSARKLIKVSLLSAGGWTLCVMLL